MKYYNMDIESIYEKLDTSINGLDEKEVEKRIEKYGKNKIEGAKKKSKIVKFLNQFNDMMIIILIIVAVLMAMYGVLYSHEYTDTIVIAVVVIINATMGFIQEQKAEVTLESLKKYVTSSCKVRRNGKIIVTDSEILVPGDIIILEAGDKIPVDARIIEETNLKVDESPLTGESVPVKKMNRILTRYITLLALI